MGVSLQYRYKTRHKMEIQLTYVELKRNFAYRSRTRCERHYRVGDIRKAKDKMGCSMSAKIEILAIAYCAKARKTKIVFRKIKDTAEIHYVDMAQCM